MKHIALCLMLFAATVLHAQTRPVNLNWQASTSVGVSGYNLYKCVIPTGNTSCTPTGSPINGSTLVTGLSYTDTQTTGTSVMYGIDAVAPPCTLTQSNTTSCGTSPLALSVLVPVPPTPLPPSASGIVIIIP